MTALALDPGADRTTRASRWIGRWRVALLLGRRDVGRHKVRTVLIVLLIAVATTVLSLAAVLLARTLTPQANVILNTAATVDSVASGSVDTASLMILGTVGALTMAQAVLLIAPAFLIGMRRQVRELGLLTSAGARPADLRRAVVAPGLVCGAVGSALGSALGFTGGMLSPAPRTGAEVSAGAVAALLVAVLGTVIATAAAWYPAALAARAHPVDALAGRMARSRPRASRRTWVAGPLGVVGVTGVVVGGALAVSGARDQLSVRLIGGVLVAEVGLLVLVAVLIGLLERMPTRRVVTAFVLRDAARHRVRVLPAVAASVAMIAGVVAAMAFQTTQHRAEAARYAYTAPLGSAFVSGAVADADALRAEAAALGPVRSVALVQVATADASQPSAWSIAGRSAWGERGSVLIASGPLVGDAALAETLGLGLGAAGALTDGFALVAAADDVSVDGAVSVGVGDQTVEVPAVVVPALHRYADVVIPAPAADRLGVSVQTVGAIVTPERAYTAGDTETLQSVVSAGDVVIETGPPGFGDAGSAYALVGAGVLAVLLITSITAALARQESLPDLITLEAVGASPRTRRRIAAGQAALIATAGSWCGVPAGLALGALFLGVQAGQPMGLGASVGPFAVPWGPVLGLLIALPVAVATLAAVTTRTSSPITRRPAR